MGRLGTHARPFVHSPVSDVWLVDYPPRWRLPTTVVRTHEAAIRSALSSPSAAAVNGGKLEAWWWR